MLITMSNKEIQRLAVLQDVRDHRITQVRAAEILNLSTRQITRLLQKLLQDRQSFKLFIRHRHQHIKPSASIIAKVHILKADIFTLEKPDISIWGLQPM